MPEPTVDVWLCKNTHTQFPDPTQYLLLIPAAVDSKLKDTGHSNHQITATHNRALLLESLTTENSANDRKKKHIPSVSRKIISSN